MPALRLSGTGQYGLSVYSQRMSPWTNTVKPRPPRGITAIGIFLACLAGTSLTWRGTALDRMWALNPRAYKDLAPFGKAVGIPFLLLGVTLAIAGVGWLRHRL